MRKTTLTFLFLLYAPIISAQYSSEDRIGCGSVPGMECHHVPSDFTFQSTPEWSKGISMPASVSAWDSDIARPPFEVDGAVVTAMIMDGNDIYVAGDFRTLGNAHGQGIAHYTALTRAWSFLDYGPRGTVRALQMHRGLLYAGGSFTTAGSNSSPANAVAVWDGTSWSEVGGGLNNTVWTLAFRGDTLFAGGEFNKTNGGTANYIAEWNGGAWHELGGGTSFPVYSLLVKGDSLYVGGNFRSAGALDVWNIALWHNGGWEGLGIGLNGSVTGLAWFKGKLVVGGDFFFSHDMNQTFYGLAQWDGSNWSGFGTNKIGMNAEGTVNSLLVIGDSLYVLGSFSSIAGVEAHGIARLSNDAWFEVGGGVYGEALTGLRTPQGLIVGGRFSKVGATKTADNIARFDGVTWSTFGDAFGGYKLLELDAVAATSKYVFFGGTFTRLGDLIANHIAAWNIQTRTWETLGAGLDGNVRSLTVQGDNLIVGGEFNRADDLRTMHIALWNMTTKTWSAMGDGSTRFISATAVHGADVYASYFAALENGSYNNYIGRWDGVNWNKLPGAFTGYINALHFSKGVLYAGGIISALDANPMSNVMAFDGSTWTGVGNGVSNRVRSLKTDAIGNLYATGDFSRAEGNIVNGISYWDGSSWHPMGAGLNNSGEALAYDGNSMYVAGAFNQADRVSVNRLAKWNGVTFQDVAGGAENTILGMDIGSNGLYIAGGFSSAGGVPSYRLAALNSVRLGVTPSVQHSSFSFSNPYPNPSNSLASFLIDIPSSDILSLELENILGQPLKHIFTGRLEIGAHPFSVQMADLPSGTYVVRANTSKGVIARHIMLVR